MQIRKTENKMNLQNATNEIMRQAETLRRIRDEVGKVMVGQEKLIDRMLIGLITGGHVLLEGVPGIAKTTAVRTLASALGLNFSRISFCKNRSCNNYCNASK